MIYVPAFHPASIIE